MAKGLTVYTSNQLEQLVDKLARVCGVHLGSVFRSETVVVQSQGMARWLSLQLADRNLICANYRFPFPNAFVHQVFKAVIPDLPAQPACRLEVLVWRVLQHLPAQLNDERFADLKHYLGTENNSRKLFQLAQKIAWLFDQYLVFRPDMIERWESGERGDWQAELWRIVSQDFESPHRAALRNEFFARIKNGKVDAKRLPERVSVFGISALPPFHMDVFAALAETTQVNLFLLQPCREFWGYISTPRELQRTLRDNPSRDEASMHLETGNRLLASMGMLGRDFLNVVFGFDNVSTTERFSERCDRTLLTTIQSDILEMADRGTAEFPPSIISNNDDSIEIHSCHSAMREVEVLHNCMLDWFRHDSTLRPRDVLVLTPDLETYGPIVQAVFGCPETPAHAIPFSVADKNPRKEGHVIETLITLLNLAESRLGVVQVLTLLECNALREQFAITERELTMIREWVDLAGIRWGIDAQHRTHFEVPGFSSNSWQQGLDRLVLGYAMHNENEDIFADTLPLELVEGTTARTLGKFLEFTNKVFALVNRLRGARSIPQWRELLRQVTFDFFELNDDTDDELRMIWQAAAKLDENARAAGYSEEVDLAVLLELLNGEFSEDARGVGFLDGGVTFASLKPMRSLPFKIICLLGMNDGTYPRHNTQLAFDLMAKDPKLGDRSTRDDDRYLFLETIISARQKLYISYQGQSVQDNSVRPPSVLVSELTDYIAQGFSPETSGSVVENITRKHRLQAFHPSYFGKGPLFSYSEENFTATRSLQDRQSLQRAFFTTHLPSPDDSWQFVSVEQLTAFFCNPSEFIARHRLGLRLPREEEELQEREPFGLDARDAYQLRQEMVEKTLSGSDAAAIESFVHASGVLPVGEAGHLIYRGLASDVSEFMTRLQPFCPNQPTAAVPVDIAVGAFHITGQITGLSATRLLRFRCAKLKAPDLLRLWISYLVIRTAGHQCNQAIHVAKDESVSFSGVSEPRQHLQTLLEIYFKGLSAPAKFFPETSFGFVDTERRAVAGRTKSDPINEAKKKWQETTIRDGGGFRTLPGESSNPYIHLCFANTEPFDDEFRRLASAVFGPLLDHLQSLV